MRRFKYFVLAIVTLSNITLFSQSLRDSLKVKTFHELVDIYNNEGSILKRKTIINYYLSKAKKENNTSELLTGYHLAAILYPDNIKKLLFADSILKLSLGEKKFNFNSGSAYALKGEYFYKTRNFKNALENYIKANEFASNKFLKHNVTSKIATIHVRMGNNQEALNLQRPNYLFAKNYIKTLSPTGYLNSVYALANTFNNLHQLDSANYYNSLGIKESLKSNLTSSYNLFLLNQGTTHYLNNNFQKAIDSLNKAFPFFKHINDLPNLSESYYFLGQSYASINNQEKAVLYFKKVDTIFSKTNDLLPSLRGNYEFLINYYKQKNQLENQLVYLNQLIKLDSLMFTNEIKLNKMLVKDYDIPKLIDEKNSIIFRLQKNKNSFTLFLVLLSVFASLTLMGFIHQYRKRKTYKNRFTNLVNNKIEDNFSTQDNDKKEKVKSIEVPEDIVLQILEEIEKFEQSNSYIDPTITLQSLSKQFNTNTSYLSKVINHYKKLSFTKYLNDLRINYFIEELKMNPILRKYTVKALAKEFGFKGSESFSKSFYAKTGLQPSYFIKELNKLNGLDL